MTKTNRFFALLLAAALAVSAAGCGAGATEPSPASTERETTAPVQTETGDRSITYEATGVRSDEVVARIDGAEAPAELLTYQIGYVCAFLDYTLQSYGMEGLDLAGALPNGENAVEYVRREALTLLKQHLVLERLAAENGIALSEEDEAEIAAQREADIAELGEETYLKQLRGMGLSPAGYDRILRASYLYQALSDAGANPDSPLYISDDTLAAHAESEGYVSADHILLMTIDPNTREPLDEETVAEKRALAEELLRQLRDSGEPVALFAQLAAEYGEDPGRQTNPTGYTFKHGTMVESFDAAARALDENKYSDVVESEYGFHIILRRPLDVNAAANAVRETYFDEWYLAQVDAEELTLTAAADRFDLVAVYAALCKAQEESLTP